MNLLSCTCLYSISLLGRGRPPLVSLFAERKEKGQNLRRKTSTSFQNQSGLLCKIFITFVLSIDVKVLTSPGWAKKSTFLPISGKSEHNLVVTGQAQERLERCVFG